MMQIVAEEHWESALNNEKAKKTFQESDKSF